MKYLSCSCLLIILSTTYSQDARKLITDIYTAQKNIYALSYHLERTDTFVTGNTRIIKGRAIMNSLPGDSLFGFSFWGQRNDLDRFSVYDGTMGYDVNNEKKKYKLYRGNSISHILGAPGGQMVLQDIGRLDTSGATTLETMQDDKFFYLTLHYPDIKEYDVTQRRKTITVDKVLLLPVRVRKYQETLGKVQHLDFKVEALKINKAASTYTFDTKPFLETHEQEIPQNNKALQSLKEKEAPVFQLKSFNNEMVSLSAMRGRVILLDFWEVWCGPCIASMPKVQELHNRYNKKGLHVFGITNEVKQLESAKQLVKKRQISFPMLAGNEAVQESYKVNAVPLYVIIDKKGLITFLSEGFSDKIETAIQRALSDE